MQRSAKIVAGFTGLIILVCAAGIVLLWYVWHTRGVLDKAISQNVGEMMAAAELEIALLRQKGLLASYLIDKGNPEWLHQLDREEASFRDALHRMGKTTRAQNKQVMLPSILDPYDAYDRFRDQVISLQKQANTGEATELYLNQVNKTYQKVAALVDEIIALNKADIQQVSISAGKRMWHLTFFVVLSASLAALLGLCLLWLVYKKAFSIRSRI